MDWKTVKHGQLRQASEGKKTKAKTSHKFWKDTGLDVGANNISCHIKINADEFALEKET